MNRRDALLKREREAAARLEAAVAARDEAAAKLKVALERGADTAQTRRVLHEARKLVRYAHDALENTSGLIEQLRDRETGEIAESMIAHASQSLAQKIAKFELPEDK